MCLEVPGRTTEVWSEPAKTVEMMREYGVIDVDTPAPTSTG